MGEHGHISTNKPGLQLAALVSVWSPAHHIIEKVGLTKMHYIPNSTHLAMLLVIFGYLKSFAFG